MKLKVTIEGEPGSGKTTLLRWIAEYVRRIPFATIEVVGDAHDASVHVQRLLAEPFPMDHGGMMRHLQQTHIVVETKTIPSAQRELPIEEK